MFADTHVHLHFPEFDADREAVLGRSREEGIDLFINVGTSLVSSMHSLELAETYSDVYATAGIHPHDANTANGGDLQALAQLLEHPRMVAIGEVGLDFFRDHSPHEKQKEILGHFLELHKKTRKPLVLHCRDAYEDLISLLKEHLKPPYAGVIHCFSSETTMMRRLLDLGLYISFAGPLTYKKNDALREACKACPEDRLLLETDAPFLPPQSMRGKRNEPGYLLETAKIAAELHDTPLEALGERTSANARKVFGLC